MTNDEIAYPREQFVELILHNSPYAFYLFQWVPYQTDAKRWRLKMSHDAKTFDGREAFGVWPNGGSFGPFKDAEVEFIRISRKQFSHTYLDPRDQQTEPKEGEDGMMTLDEAINHAEEVEVSNCSPACREEHKNLALWLKELSQLRTENARLTAELAEAKAAHMTQVSRQARTILELSKELKTATKFACKWEEAEHELAELRAQEPVAFITYKGHLLHADDPRVKEHSDPAPLFARPVPAAQAVPETLVKWSRCNEGNPDSAWGPGYEDARRYVAMQLAAVPQPPADHIPAVTKTVEPSEYAKDAVRDAVAQALGDVYCCTRVWNAWSYGTMGPDDFHPAAEDDDVLSAVTDAAMAAMQKGASS